MRQVSKSTIAATILVVAGVVQENSIRPGSKLRSILHTNKTCLVALRLSGSKFRGKGGTGKRLFNTTEWDETDGKEWNALESRARS